MIFSRADLPHLKWSLLSFLCVLCAGGAGIALSKHFAAQAQREQQAARHHLNTAHRQLAIATEDRENMKAYALEYGELLKRNVIGDDRRMDWVEGLERIRKQHRVLNFKYSFSPQHSYIPPSALGSGNFVLNMSDMTLQFDLLHEEQLMDFFDTMRTDIGGWFILDHCTLERNGDPDAIVQLKAECAGGWLTLAVKATRRTE